MQIRSNWELDLQPDTHIASFYLENCDLKQIAESGQCFRWYELSSLDNVAYLINNADEQAVVEQEVFEQAAGRLTLFFRAGSFEKWLNYLDSATDYTAIIDSIPEEDQYLHAAADSASGLRILNADLWETMITFLISQNNNIPRIKKSVLELCERLGPVLEGPLGPYAGFPGPEKLMRKSDLQGLGLGYRDNYISELARDVYYGQIDLDAMRGMELEQARKCLKSIYGIGDKVCECILLFGLGHKEAFPIDTWMKKIIDREYGGRFPIERYPTNAGVIQQYMFYSERRREGKT